MTWSDERDAERAATSAMAEALAALMPGWQVVTRGDWGDWFGLRRDSDGATFSVTVGGYQARGRVTFRGVAPTYSDHRTYSMPGTEITCNASRAPASILRDLERRLLAIYLPRYAEAVAWVREHEGHGVEAEAVAKRLAPIVDGQLGRDRRSYDEIHIHDRTRSVYGLKVSPAYGKEGTTHHGPVRVSFRAEGLDPETAAQVLEIIAAAEARAEAGRARIADDARAEAGRARIAAPEFHDEPAEEAENEPIRARIVAS